MEQSDTASGLSVHTILGPKGQKTFMTTKVLQGLLDAYGYTYSLKKDQLVIFVPEGQLIEWEMRTVTCVGAVEP